MKASICIVNHKQLNIESELKLFGINAQHIDLTQPLVQKEEIQFLTRSQFLIIDQQNYSKELIRSCEQLKLIFCTDFMLNQTEESLAKKKNIMVFDLSSVLSHAVAEHTMALILGCLKNITWQPKGFKEKPFNSLLKNKTVGLIGWSKSAKILSNILLAFNCHVLVFDPDSQPKDSNIISTTNLEDIKREAQIISLHSKATTENYQIINKKFINQLNWPIILINTEHKNLVNHRDLEEALLTKKILGAGLDAYETTSRRSLKRFEHVILTPNIAKNIKVKMDDIKTLILDKITSNIKSIKQSSKSFQV